MRRDDTRALASALFDRIAASGIIPRLVTAETVTSGTQPEILVSGTTENIPAQQLGDPSGVGETVWAIQWRGSTLVIGRAAGSRLLGKASTSSNQLGITSVVTLTGLEVNVVVTQPGRSLKIEGQVQVQASTAGGEVSGQIQQDGVTVGRYGRFTVARDNQVNTMSGFTYVDDLDPGGYVFTLTLSCATTGSVNTNSATVASWISVKDAGAA